MKWLFFFIVYIYICLFVLSVWKPTKSRMSISTGQSDPISEKMCFLRVLRSPRISQNSSGYILYKGFRGFNFLDWQWHFSFGHSLTMDVHFFIILLFYFFIIFCWGEWPTEDCSLSDASSLLRYCVFFLFYFYF